MGCDAMDNLELRTAFYPCCGEDSEIPLQILQPYVDRVIFCDRSPCLIETYKAIELNVKAGLPKVRFISGCVADVLKMIQRIDVLFYRCDSNGEGGSGVFVLGNWVLQKVINRMPCSGGLIITDGSNSRQSNFEKMIRCNGLKKFGWNMEPYPDMPEIKPPDGRSYCTDRLLHVVQVSPIIEEAGPPLHFDLSTIYM